MNPSILSKPFAYNFKKIFKVGYTYIDIGKKRTALSLEDRRLVEAISKTWNFPRFLNRVALWRREKKRAKPIARLADGYAIVHGKRLAAIEEGLEVCDRQIAVYMDYLAGKRDGIANLAAYEQEMEKTRTDPLKHIPYRYDAEATRALTKMFLAPELYLTAANYLRVLPVLTSMRILYSPNEASEVLTNAQMFHTDPEGLRQVKVFIAIRDVGPENSPLTFISESMTSRAKASGDERMHRKRVPDNALLRQVKKSQWIAHEGKRGDILFLDTSRCLHFGSRPNTKPRLLLYGQYLDPFCSKYPVSAPSVSLQQTHGHYQTDDPIEQYLLGKR